MFIIHYVHISVIIVVNTMYAVRCEWLLVSLEQKVK
jgi:hypothetical protein